MAKVECVGINGFTGAVLYVVVIYTLMIDRYISATETVPQPVQLDSGN
jgi:hypothetical protein